MKARELRGRDDAALNGELLDLKKEQLNLRFQRATGQLENTARIRDVRRGIARIRSVLGERRRAAGAAPADNRTDG